MIRVAILAALLAAGPAYAEADWKKAAEVELGYAQLAMTAGGWTLRRQLDPRTLGDAQTGSESIFFGVGREYAVVALCDEHCGDIDLALYGPDDALLTEDCAETGLPIVRVTPTERGRHELEVRMIDCAEEACHYSVAVFTRPTSTGPVTAAQEAPR